MSKVRLALIAAVIFAIQPCFADDLSSADSKPCAAIAKACAAGGFDRSGNSGKRFWQDCMKPIVLGKSVKGVTIDANTVKQCRTDKIAQLKKELNELQKVSQ